MAQLPQDPGAMAPQGAPAPGAQSEQAPQQGGGAKELLLGAHDAMAKLADAMAQSGQVDDHDIEMAQQIVSMIEELGSSLGGKKGGPGGPVPQETGGKPASQAM